MTPCSSRFNTPKSIPRSFKPSNSYISMTLSFILDSIALLIGNRVHNPFSAPSFLPLVNLKRHNHGHNACSEWPTCSLNPRGSSQVESSTSLSSHRDPILMSRAWIKKLGSCQARAWKKKRQIELEQALLVQAWLINTLNSRTIHYMLKKRISILHLMQSYKSFHFRFKV